MGTHGPGGLTRKHTTSRPDNVWPDMWKHMSNVSKKKAKQRWAIEKLKLNNARQLRGIFFIEPNDEELKDIMKAARGKLEVPPQCWETQDKIRLCCWCRREHETKAGRSRTQPHQKSHHCKRDEFYDSLQSCSQIHPDASSIENSGCKVSSGERM